MACAILAACANEKKPAPARASAPPPPPPPAAPPATPSYETVSGRAIAEDGDTVIIGDKSLDLWGVEAPNLTNSDGWYSRAALDRFIGANGQISCIIKVERKRSRDLAICSNSRVGDLGRAMLLNGWAVVSRRDIEADPKLARAYESTEQRARENRSGLWVNYPLK